MVLATISAPRSASALGFDLASITVGFFDGSSGVGTVEIEPVAIGKVLAAGWTIVAGAGAGTVIGPGGQPTSNAIVELRIHATTGAIASVTIDTIPARIVGRIGFTPETENLIDPDVFDFPGFFEFFFLTDPLLAGETAVLWVTYAGLVPGDQLVFSAYGAGDLVASNSAVLTITVPEPARPEVLMGLLALGARAFTARTWCWAWRPARRRPREYVLD